MILNYEAAVTQRQGLRKKQQSESRRGGGPAGSDEDAGTMKEERSREEKRSRETQKEGHKQGEFPMTEKTRYKCVNCDGRVEAAKEGETPQCCGQPMVETAEPLDQCTLSGTAEHARFDDTQEPCDDGRSG
jgi:hypothetical protein